jgi:hypothetical protein
MIFRAAHDTDCIPGEELVNLERDRRIYQYGLNRADLISAQSATQVHALEENYGLRSVEVDMAAEIPQDPGDSGRDINDCGSTISAILSGLICCSISPGKCPGYLSR